MPQFVHNGAQRVSEMVAGMVQRIRFGVSPEEERLRIHLRGNEPLYVALTDLIRSRIEGRAGIPLPSDPLTCYGIMAMDKELRWLLARLELVYRSPVQDQGEQPEE